MFFILFDEIIGFYSVKQLIFLLNLSEYLWLKALNTFHILFIQIFSTNFLLYWRVLCILVEQYCFESFFHTNIDYRFHSFGCLYYCLRLNSFFYFPLRFFYIFELTFLFTKNFQGLENLAFFHVIIFSEVKHKCKYKDFIFNYLNVVLYEFYFYLLPFLL